MVGRFVCGFYYRPPHAHLITRLYLPLVDLKSHTTILSSTSRTMLTQTFVNPGDQSIQELRYTFPLYDGVSVVGFTCRIQDRVIKGVVKERAKARKDYQEAVDRGETAGLLEQLPDASDVFTTTVGNVPAGATLVVELIYLGELRHDAEVDGIRFTIPTSIAPRYGSPTHTLMTPSNLQAHPKGGIGITVDATMAEGSFIREMRSPSHPIAISMGTTSAAPNADPQLSKASATLSLGTAALDKDFILQVVAKDSGVPKAILETHPTIPNQRALMATLVPKFSLPPEKPEIVFICDRSGSMGGGNKIPTVVSALMVFLKSLPVGVKFNICSFGSSYSFLWPKSKTYNELNLKEAVRHVETFNANFGGTEMFRPIKATLQQRYKDIPLEVMLLTDGQIWHQQQLFDYLNKEVIESKAPIRVFTLGVGNEVSHTLIEGIARAGHGFSQAVGQNEKLDSKVVRMLKGALSPHVINCTLEVKYADEDKMSDEEDFEIIEEVSDSLLVKLDLADTGPKKKKAPISLFDLNINFDRGEPAPQDETRQSCYSYLPSITVPKLLQAPHHIPPLFPFNRTSIYLLMSPDTVQKNAASVVLRGTSAHGPLELEIPVQVLDEPGETIHQLAAKKAVAELEEGRGWIADAKTEDGKLLKERFESRFEDIVEREAARLGVQFQVGGKFCSFVAVEADGEERRDDENERAAADSADNFLEENSRLKRRTFAPASRAAPSPFGLTGGGLLRSAPRPAGSIFVQAQQVSASPFNTGANPEPRVNGRRESHNIVERRSRGFGQPTFGLFSLAAPSNPPSIPARGFRRIDALTHVPPDIPGLDGGPHRAAPALASSYDPTIEESTTAVFGASEPRSQPTSALHALIAAQSFAGSFPATPEVLQILGVSAADVERVASEQGVVVEVVVTQLVIAFFEDKLADERESWELVVEKARRWVDGW